MKYGAGATLQSTSIRSQLGAIEAVQELGGVDDAMGKAALKAGQTFA